MARFVATFKNGRVEWRVHFTADLPESVDERERLSPEDAAMAHAGQLEKDGGYVFRRIDLATIESQADYDAKQGE